MDTLTGTHSVASPLSMMASSQASVEAIMRSGQIWADGCKAIGDIMAAMAQAHLEQTKSAWQAMSHVKTLKEAVDIQSGFARSSTEQSMAGATKLMEATNKLAQEAMAPITERFAQISPMSGLVG